MAAPVLVGRDRELEQAAEALDRAARERAATLIVRGVTGIGKTAFLERVSACASDRFRTLWISGHPAEADLPYAGVQQLERALEGVIDYGASRLDIASQLLQAVARNSEARPLLLVIDDAHQLDSGSLQALIFVARRLDAEAVCVMFSVSSEEGHEDRFSQLGVDIELQELDPDSALEVVQVLAPRTTPRVALQVVEHASGVPLSIRDTLAGLTDAQKRGRDPLPLDLPVAATLKRRFVECFDRLEDAERIAILALCFDSFDQASRAEVFDTLGCRVEDLEAAERSGLIEYVEDAPRFTHPMIPASLRRAARHVERTRVHRVFAAQFAHEPLRRIRHLQRIDSIPDRELVDALVAAAAAAAERQGYAEAGEYWEQAALIADSDDARLANRCRVQAADASVKAGLMTAADRILCELTESADDDDVRAEHLASRVFVSLWAGEEPGKNADALIEFGLGLVACEDASQSAAREAGRQLVMALAIAALGSSRYSHAQIVTRRLAEVSNKPASLDEALVADASAVMVGDPAAGDMLRGEWRSDYPWHQIAGGKTPIPFVAFTLTMLGEHRLVEQVMDRYEQSDAAAGRTAEGVYLQRSLAAMLAQRRGDWDRALKEYESLQQFIIETDSSGPLPFVSLLHAQLLGLRGHRAEADSLRRDARWFTPVWSPMMQHLDSFIAGQVSLVHREYERAARHFEEVRAIEMTEGLAPSGYLTALPDAVEAAWHLGCASDFAADLDRYERLAEGMRHAQMRALARRSRALFVTDPEALDICGAHFEAALGLLAQHREEQDERGSQGFEEARTRLLWGQTLRRGRRKAEALRQLAEAERIFEALGAAPLVETCRAELAACGRRRADEAAPAGSPIAQLTPREYEVAREVARGATNAEAASRLFISERTVEFHLSGVFRKLQLGGRAQLAEALDERASSATLSEA